MDEVRVFIREGGMRVWVFHDGACRFYDLDGMVSFPSDYVTISMCEEACEELHGAAKSDMLGTFDRLAALLA